METTKQQINSLKKVLQDVNLHLGWILQWACDNFLDELEHDKEWMKMIKDCEQAEEKVKKILKKKK